MSGFPTLTAAVGSYVKQHPVATDYALYVEYLGEVRAGGGVSFSEGRALVVDQAGALVWLDRQTAQEEELKGLQGDSLQTKLLELLGQRLGGLFGLNEATRQAAAARHPEWALLSQGKEAAAARKWDEALAAYEKAVAAAPENQAAWAGRHNALGYLKREADAAVVLEQWLKACPRDPQPLTIKMMFAAMAGRTAEALAAVDKLIELDPANGDYYCGRGNFLKALGRKDEAIAAFDAAITKSLSPLVRADSLRAGMGVALQQKQYDVAVGWCTKVLVGLPKDAAPADAAALWYQRAAARALSNDAANALADLARAIHLDPACRDRAAKDPAFKGLAETAAFKDLRPVVPETGVKLTTEWQALHGLVGQWELVETVTIPKPEQLRATLSAAWTLGDHFLEVSGRSAATNFEAKRLLTYDEKRQALRGWWFTSQGAALSAAGRWDAATKTFTWQGTEPAETPFTLTDRAVDNDHREWTLAIRNAAGQVVYASTATATRQKP